MEDNDETPAEKVGRRSAVIARMAHVPLSHCAGVPPTTPKGGIGLEGEYGYRPVSCSPIRGMSTWNGYHICDPNTLGCGIRGRAAGKITHDTFIVVSGVNEVIIVEKY